MTTSERPLVTIITPVYKVEEWLPACIESVQRQTLTDWELILVDDGSPDRSGAICDRYADTDKRIRVIHKQNSGVSAARNDALDQARGRYITFLDSDDEIELPDTLEQAAGYLNANHDVGILQYRLRSSNRKDYAPVNPRKIIGASNVLRALDTFEFTGYLFGKIYRAELFDGIRLPYDITFAEDTYCLLDMLPRLGGAVFISDTGGYLYNVRSDSAVHSFDARKCRDYFLMSFRFHTELLRHLPDTDSTVVQYFFRVYQRLLDARIACPEMRHDTYTSALRRNIPALTTRGLTRKQRLWLLLLHAFGITITSDIYVNTVRRRLKREKKK